MKPACRLDALEARPRRPDSPRARSRRRPPRGCRRRGRCRRRSSRLRGGSRSREVPLEDVERVPADLLPALDERLVPFGAAGEDPEAAGADVRLEQVLLEEEPLRGARSAELVARKQRAFPRPGRGGSRPTPRGARRTRARARASARPGFAPCAPVSGTRPRRGRPARARARDRAGPRGAAPCNSWRRQRSRRDGARLRPVHLRALMREVVQQIRPREDRRRPACRRDDDRGVRA